MSLVEIMSDASRLPLGKRDGRQWTGREDEYKLLERVLPPERVDTWQKKGITVRRGVTPGTPVTRLRIDVINGHRHWFEIKYERKEDSSTLEVFYQGRGVSERVTTAQDFVQLIERKALGTQSPPS